jgi:hypothetical protein
MTTLFRMKSNCIAIALALILCAGCATTKPDGKKSAEPKNVSDTETVLITYRVKSGSEVEFEQVLAQAWQIYRHEHLVLAQPHVIVRDKESGGKTRFVEIFTWVSHAAPDHAPASVKKIWDRMMALCEKRDGHGGLEGGEVEVVHQAK